MLIRNLLLISVGAAAIAVVMVRILPADYVASTTLMLDTSSESFGGIDLSQFSDYLPGGGLGLQGGKENGYSYPEIVQSRTILQGVLAKRDPVNQANKLFDRFAPARGTEARRWEVAVKRLKSNVKTEYQAKQGLFRIDVSDRNPFVAAAIADSLVASLREFNLEVRQTRARDAVEFVQGRLEEAGSSLQESEDKLATFLQRNARIGNAPGLLLEQKRLERAVRLDEDTYALLARQLELARIQEKREAPVFSVMDPAIPPARPKRFPSPYAAMLGAFIACTSFVILKTGSSALETSRLLD